MRPTDLTRARCSCSCFGSAMGNDVMSKVGMSESGPGLWLRFTTSIKRKGKTQSSKPTAFSNLAVQISPACLINGKPKALVRIVSISRDEELIPVILSSVGPKAISSEQQSIKKTEQLGFDAAEMEVKSRDANITVRSSEPEICTQELAADHISEDRRSCVRIAKAFRFPKAPDFQRNGPGVSRNPIRRNHSKGTKMPVIEHHKAEQIREQKKIADSIPGPIEQPCKSSHTSAAVDSKSSKLWKFIDFHRKGSSHANKSREIKSSPLSQLPCAGMNSTTPNSQPKKLHMSAERKRTTTGDATGDGEGYDTAMNLLVLIIIMACLAVFSNMLLAIVCTSIWWYLLPSLLEKYVCQQHPGCVNCRRSDLKHKRQINFN